MSSSASKVGHSRSLNDIRSESSSSESRRPKELPRQYNSNRYCSDKNNNHNRDRSRSRSPYYDDNDRYDSRRSSGYIEKSQSSANFSRGTYNNERGGERSFDRDRGSCDRNSGYQRDRSDRDENRSRPDSRNSFGGDMRSHRGSPSGDYRNNYRGGNNNHCQQPRDDFRRDAFNNNDRRGSGGQNFASKSSSCDPNDLPGFLPGLFANVDLKMWKSKGKEEHRAKMKTLKQSAKSDKKDRFLRNKEADAKPERMLDSLRKPKHRADVESPIPDVNDDFEAAGMYYGPLPPAPLQNNDERANFADASQTSQGRKRSHGQLDKKVQECDDDPYYGYYPRSPVPVENLYTEDESKRRKVSILSDNAKSATCTIVNENAKIENNEVPPVATVNSISKDQKQSSQTEKEKSPQPKGDEEEGELGDSDENSAL